jgi:hypothetical protein
MEGCVKLFERVLVVSLTLMMALWECFLWL